MSKRFVKPFLGETGEKELDDKTLGDAFIELAIIKGKDVDEKFLNSNRDYHLQQMLLEKRLVTLDQLVLQEDRFVMISGMLFLIFLKSHSEVVWFTKWIFNFFLIYKRIIKRFLSVEKIFHFFTVMKCMFIIYYI